MPNKLSEFRLLADTLRGHRSAITLLLNQTEDLVNSMSDDEQEIANSEGWRGWPDLYDEHMRNLIETVDPDNRDMRQYHKPKDLVNQSHKRRK